MKYKLTIGYRWLNTIRKNSIVRMYFIQDIPYTFDEISKITGDDPSIIEEANMNRVYTDEDIYLNSSYLVIEEAHPCLFDIDVDCPEILNEMDFNS